MNHIRNGKDRLRALFILLVVAGLGTQLYAGGQDRAGTSAAPHLLIPIGARYLAMGGGPTANATGVEALFWNPAGVDRSMHDVDAMFSHRTFIADIALNYFAVTGKLGFGTVGLSLKSLNIGDIPVTTEAQPDGTGEIFSPSYFVLGVTYSRQLTDRISIGVSANMISETFAQVSSTGISFDAGVQYRDVLAIPRLDIGVAMKNIGPPMKYGGSGLWIEASAPGSQRGVTFYKVEAAAFELPSVVEIGIAYTNTFDESNRLQVSGTFQNNNYAYDEYRLGLEYAFKDMLFLRGGGLIGAGSSDQTPHIFQNLTLGAGVMFTNVEGVNVAVDYAYVPVKYFTTNHAFSIKLGF